MYIIICLFFFCICIQISFCLHPVLAFYYLVMMIILFLYILSLVIVKEVKTHLKNCFLSFLLYDTKSLTKQYTISLEYFTLLFGFFPFFSFPFPPLFAFPLCFFFFLSSFFSPAFVLLCMFYSFLLVYPCSSLM